MENLFFWFRKVFQNNQFRKKKITFYEREHAIDCNRCINNNLWFAVIDDDLFFPRCDGRNKVGIEFLVF